MKYSTMIKNIEKTGMLVPAISEKLGCHSSTIYRVRDGITLYPTLPLAEKIKQLHREICEKI